MSKKEFSVTVRKVLCGEIEIEAEDYDEALNILEYRMDIDQNINEDEVYFNSEHWEIPDLC